MEVEFVGADFYGDGSPRVRLSVTLAGHTRPLLLPGAQFLVALEEGVLVRC